MKNAVFTILAVILTLSLVSCGPAGTVTVTQTETETVTNTVTQEVINTSTLTHQLTTEYGQLLKSDKAYDSSPNVSDETLTTLVNGNNKFAFDLYKQLVSTEEGNLFYSPYSISLAFAMLYANPVPDEIKEQMKEALDFYLDDEELHSAFNKLALELAGRSEENDKNRFALNIANAIWGQEDYKFSQEFLDILAENYDAGIRLLDFLNKSEEARQIINEWVNDETNGKIQELIAEREIDPATEFIITSAIYFKAEWFAPFMKELTHDADFTLLDSSTVTVSMMEQQMQFNYEDGSNYQAIELQYKGKDFSMVILLPDEGNFEEFEAALDAQKIDEIINGMQNDVVVLSMPKFTYEADINLAEILDNMGLPVTELQILDAAHQACISVDELGTEAAAAVWVAVGAAPSNYFTMDRPFIYLIRDNVTNTILFVGRVMNPAE
jgi:serpin B